ncbi:MAG TPA: cytochrome c3 family protein [Ignavibacteriales bacterium]|nr:cytochrome c3 family protein [Ignavibacteriales bacterium]
MLCGIYSAAQAKDNSKCYRCHSMATLGYKDSTSGTIRNLSVLPDEFAKSNHKDLQCKDCHMQEYAQYPHPAETKKENLYCLNCHIDNPELAKYSFKDVERQFKESVHYKKLKDKFTCFSCHDPHSFKINARLNEDVKQTVLYDNQICMDCHAYSDKIESLSGAMLPNLEISHSWLPHLDMHWKSVRCLDCHADPASKGVSHKILAKESAVKNCVECHSKDSRLVHSLYKFKSKEEKSEYGFFNAVLFNDAYVIGATRNYYLNWASFVVFGGMIILLSVHGYFRYKSKRKK